MIYFLGILKCLKSKHAHWLGPDLWQCQHLVIDPSVNVLPKAWFNQYQYTGSLDSDLGPGPLFYDKYQYTYIVRLARVKSVDSTLGQMTSTTSTNVQKLDHAKSNFQRLIDPFLWKYYIFCLEICFFHKFSNFHRVNGVSQDLLAP